MIKRLQVSGYKSFKNIEIFLVPLSVIFGPNAAGKSNLLDALNLLARIVTAKNLKEAFEKHRGLPVESFHYGEKGYKEFVEQESAEAHFEVDVALSAATINAVEKLIAEKRKGIDTGEQSLKRISEKYLRYAVTLQILPGSGHLRIIDESLCALKRNGQKKARNPFVEKDLSSGKARIHLRMEGQAHPFYYDIGLDHSVLSLPLYEPHYPHITAFRHEITTWRVYDFKPHTLMGENTPVRPIEAIGHQGENLVAFLNTIQAGGKKQMETFNRSLHSLLPSIERIVIERTKKGLLYLCIIEGGRVYPSRIISEGTLRALGLLAVLHPASSTTVIGFEEPENGIHPTRLQQVADLFKNAQETSGKQIIVNTHSPVFSACFEDRNLFVCRKEGTETKIANFKTAGPLFKTEDIAKGLEEWLLSEDETKA